MKKIKRIDFEAHFYSQNYIDAMYKNKNYPRFEDNLQTKNRMLRYNPEIAQPFADTLMDRLLDLGEKRIQKMDKCGVDVQILSLSAPGIEQFDTKIGTELARRANNGSWVAARVILPWPTRKVSARSRSMPAFSISSTRMTGARLTRAASAIIRARDWPPDSAAS